MNLKSMYFEFRILFIICLLLGVFAQLVGPTFAPDQFQYGLAKYFKDPVLFHEIADKMANQIHEFGWSKFNLWPDQQFPAGVLGAIYAITGVHKPILQIPINALFFSLTGLIVIQLLKDFFTNRILQIVLVLVLLVSPTSIWWVTQISKDIYINFAILLYFFHFYLLAHEKYIHAFVSAFISALTVFLVKNHWIEIILYLSLLLYPFCIFFQRGNKLKKVMPCLLAVIALFVFQSFSFKYHETPPTHVATGSNFAEVAKTGHKLEKDFTYRGEFPIFDKIFNRLAFANYRFHSDHPGRENYRPDFYINSTTTAIEYLPGAMFYGLASPTPFESRWSQGLGKGVSFLIIQIEMLFLYLSIGLIVFNWKKIIFDNKILILAWSVVALAFVLIFVYSTPNLGSINRYRYPFFVPFKFYGFIFLTQLVKKHASKT